MMIKRKTIAVAVALTLPVATLLGGNATAAAAAADDVATTLPEVTVRATSQPIGASHVDDAHIARMRAATSDTAGLLGDEPGVSLYGAGGVSSLPTMHGMADDRLRIKERWGLANRFLITTLTTRTWVLGFIILNVRLLHFTKRDADNLNVVFYTGLLHL